MCYIYYLDSQCLVSNVLFSFIIVSFPEFVSHTKRIEKNCNWQVSSCLPKLKFTTVHTGFSPEQREYLFRRRELFNQHSFVWNVLEDMPLVYLIMWLWNELQD